LSIKVTLLLQSNSEEIERISFVQHYKRKAVESKATIQPFAREEEAGSQGTWQLTKNNEGSNGSYKRGAYRGNRSDKNSLQGNVAELGNNITNMEFNSRVKRFTRTAEAIANYAGKEFSKEMKLLVKNHQKMNPKSR
jgi:hypothetical protein